MRIFALIFVSLLAFFLSLNIEKFISIGNVSLKPVIILLYFTTLYWKPMYGLVTGFFLGFLYEIYLPVFTGTYPLIFTSVAFCLSLIEKKIFKFRYNSLILLFCTVLFVGLVQIIIEVDKINSVFYIIFTHLIPEAILNSAVGFVILYFIKRYRHE
ncbi:rod shape-determining protein MreD [candidate division WOR-3 bacterium]|nr:rod shape-determining protein MreD [candidate division WOR-3 bacterium]